MAVIEAVGTLTARYQTTVPAPVRRALRLRKHDKIVYKVLDENKVVLERQTQEESDPVLGQFLDFLARDFAAGTVGLVTPELVGRIRELVGAEAVDLDAPLSPEDED